VARWCAAVITPEPRGEGRWLGSALRGLSRPARKDATTKARDPGFVFQRTVLYGPAEDAVIVPRTSEIPIHDRVLAMMPAGFAVFMLPKE
jgi:hypothetical protein